MIKPYVALSLLVLAGCNISQEPVPAPISPTLPRVQQIGVSTATPQPVATATAAVATATPTLSAEDEAALQAIQAFKSADPIADAEAALKSGEKRLLAIHTVGLMVPGVEPQKVAVLSQQHGLKTIAEVGDANVSPTKSQLYDVAFDYASRYNRRLLSQFAGR